MTYRDFKVTHLYKYNTGVQLLWGSKKYDEWEFNETYFAIDGHFENDVNKIFNSTKNISNAIETIDAPSNLNNILDKQRIGLRKKG